MSTNMKKSASPGSHSRLGSKKKSRTYRIHKKESLNQTVRHYLYFLISFKKPSISNAGQKIGKTIENGGVNVTRLSIK